jgi:hypothetical protein
LSQPINRLVLRAGSSDWQDETLALVSLAPFDSAGTKYVQRDIEVITLLRPITLGLLAIAAVITPLGFKEPSSLQQRFVQSTLSDNLTRDHLAL